MEELSIKFNEAIDKDDVESETSLNPVVADIERKKIVIQDQLRKLETMDDDAEASFKGIWGFS